MLRAAVGSLARKVSRSHLSHSAACRISTTSSCQKDVDYMDFPGGKVPFTEDLAWLGPGFTPRPTIPCYRALDSQGAPLPGTSLPHDIDQALATRMYETMISLQAVDTIFYEAQRQGRFSFYMTSTGEESTAVASAAALNPDDVVFTQYREQGVLMWRGYTPLDMANQCYGNALDSGKGRQMPVHYGSKALNFHTISSPLATQLPQAVGAAYALKLEGKAAVAACYFGEGAASEGDFHAALNFSATLSAPVVFICRNNGWAISTPASEQYRGDGIAGRGPSYGVPSLRVDGGDAVAVYNAVAEARRVALERRGPVLLEAMSYRSGHHSTSDDSSRYRAAEEMAAWRARDPVARFERWMAVRGWWDEARGVGARKAARREAIAALAAAAKQPRPPLSEMFSDVYDEPPPHLVAQRAEVEAFVRAHPETLPAGMPLE
ncbi:hypothetical protein ACKKBF_B38180 [Auxenochlorella protothecoides x Auxenochlorella symbiontica]|uniref:3-methyl-2-oxobutanoate dehydrogenase (2-methylpropanoyl-transferring) n=2 Tax=Auxenochlorella protothecoides TaxID=3075 RepID=A0A1D2AB23_AUXPR